MPSQSDELQINRLKASVNRLKASARPVVGQQVTAVSEAIHSHARSVDDGASRIERLRAINRETPPDEFIRPMRSAGPEQLVELEVQGRQVQVLVRPLGCVDTSAEQQAWLRINQYFEEL